MIWKKTGVVPEQLNLEIPELFYEVWTWFLELNKTRGSNGFTPSPISYMEIKAWSDLTNRKPTSHQVALINELDRIVLNGK